MRVDDSELREFAAKVDKIPGRVFDEAVKVGKRGVQNIKDELVADAKASIHFKRVARAISYDEKWTRHGVGFEIGPDKNRDGGGKLANIAYFGGANGGGATLDFDKPIKNEEPNIEKHLDKVLGDALTRLL